MPGRHEAVHAESRLRVQTTIRLRWFAVAGQALAVAIVALWFGFELPVGWCLLAIACSAWVNIYLRVTHPGAQRLDVGLATALLAYDIAQLATLLFMTGGLQNPFTVLVVAPVTVSAASLPPRSTILLGGFALGVTVLLAFFHLPLPWLPGAELVLPDVYKLGLFSAVASCLTFLALYAWRLAKEARDMSAALAATELVLAREQRLHALDGLAAAAAHELGTPLATIAVVARELQREAKENPNLADDLKLLTAEAQRCREILQKLTRAPTERDPMHAEMPLEQIAEEAAEPYRDRGATIEVRRAACEGEIPLTERSPGVLFGVGNLIENAVDFADAHVWISLAWSADDVSITIVDDGPGFPPDILDHLGEPYVTSRGRNRGEQRGGLGLGVFIAKTLLERSGATLSLANRTPPETGAVARIVWPRSRFDVQPLKPWPGA